MGNTFYENDPDLRYYFENLPIAVKNRILESGAEISTLGELMQAAEHMEAEMKTENRGAQADG